MFVLENTSPPLFLIFSPILMTFKRLFIDEEYGSRECEQGGFLLLIFENHLQPFDFGEECIWMFW